MSYIAGVIDSCGSIRGNRVRVNCPAPVINRMGKLLDSHTIPYRLNPPYLTISQEEGLVILYGSTHLVCTSKRAALKRMVSRICIGGLEPYPYTDMDDMGWLQGVLDMRGSHIVTGGNQWYSITHTDTDLINYLGSVLTKVGIDYNLYTVERDGRRTLYNIRIYKAASIRKVLEILTTQ